MTGRPPAGEVIWGLGDAAAAFVAAVLLSSLVFGLLGSPSGSELTLGEMAATQAALWVGYAGVPMLVVHYKGNGARADLGLDYRRFDLPAGLALGAATQVLVWAMYWPAVRYLDLDVGAPAREVVDRASGVGTVLLVLLVGIGTPIAEEIFFRGLLWRALDRRVGAGWAVVLSALIFAALHLQLVQFPGLVIVGLVTAEAVRRTGRLVPAIAVHAGFNLTTLAALLL